MSKELSFTYFPYIANTGEINSEVHTFPTLEFSKELYKEEYFNKSFLKESEINYQFSDVKKFNIVDVFINNYKYDTIDFQKNIKKYSYYETIKDKLFESFLRFKYNHFNFLLINDTQLYNYEGIEEYFDYITNNIRDNSIKLEFEKSFHHIIKSKKYDPVVDFIIFRAFKKKDSLLKLISSKSKLKRFEYVFYMPFDSKQEEVSLLTFLKLIIEIYGELNVCKFLLNEDEDSLSEILNIGLNLLKYIDCLSLKREFYDKKNISLLSNELKRIRNIYLSSIEITFPFSMYNDLNSLKIYQYTLDEILDKESSSMVHIEENNEGSLYNTKIDGLLCTINKLNYPTAKINRKKIFKDASIYINTEKSSIQLKDDEENIYDIYKYIKNPPKSIRKLTIIVKGNIEFYFFD